jgi:hypothetical protein
MNRPGRIPGFMVIRFVLVAIGVGVICLSILVGTLFNRVNGEFVTLNRERARNVAQNCLDTNRRHDLTVRRLHQLVNELPPGPRKVRAVQGMAGSIALINALAPRRDCRALAARQVRTNP